MGRATRCWMASWLVSLACTADGEQPPRAPADPAGAADSGTPSGEPSPIAEESATSVQAPAARAPAPELLGQLEAGFLGGPLRTQPVAPGRWGTRVAFSQHRFLTMEITTSSGVQGEAVLSLQRDGVVHACFRVETHDGSSSSKYANRDGIARSRQSDSGRLVGARGKWSEQGAGVRIELDRVRWDGCQIMPDTEPTPEPLRMECLAFAATERIPSPWLACRVDDERAPMAALGLALDGSGRAGAWEHRRDPSGRGESPPDDPNARPWLLLAKPALEVDADDTDRSGNIEVGFRLATGELDESRWTQPEHRVRETPDQPEAPLEPPLP